MKTKSIYSFGNKTGRGKKYISPTKEERLNVRKLANKLSELDNNNNKILSNSMNKLLNELKLDIYKIEEKKGCYALVPKTYGQFCLFYNTCKIKYPTGSNKETYNNEKSDYCVPFILNNCHSGKDNIDRISYLLFLKNNYKLLIVNGYHPGASNQKSPYSEKHWLSNADHSPDPSMNEFIDEYVNNVYPGLGMYILHGMSSKQTQKVWFISSTGNNVNYNQRNINFLMVVAWALDNKARLFQGQTNNNLSKFYIRRPNGTKRFLTNDDFTNTFFRHFRGPTSSVGAHIINYGEISKKVGTDKGIVCHAEHAISTLGNRSEIVSDVHKKALEWYLLWDENKHKFEDVPEDLSKFDEWIKNV